MVSDENGCADSDTLLLNTYKAGFVNAGPDQFIAFGEPLKLFGIADPGRVKWISDRWLSCDTCLQTNSYTDTTAFYVLKLVDKNGCEYADTMKVQLEGSLYLPNTFTPNEDGINETFGALSIDVTKFRLEIFNRWGELLFTSLEAGTGWDGRYKGQVVQTDVYIYKLRYTLNSGREERKRGWVLLVK
jgi:gliding motility-associated-like protein